jgi:hypothetical protein
VLEFGHRHQRLIGIVDFEQAIKLNARPQSGNDLVIKGPA